MEILYCDCCLLPFNASSCFAGGTCCSRVDTTVCPHCRQYHNICVLRKEQKKIKDELKKLVK